MIDPYRDDLLAQIEELTLRLAAVEDRLAKVETLPRPGWLARLFGRRPKVFRGKRTCGCCKFARHSPDSAYWRDPNLCCKQYYKRNVDDDNTCPSFVPARRFMFDPADLLPEEAPVKELTP